MNFLVRSLALAALLISSVGVARRADASVVVTKAGGDVHVSDVRLAHATSATRTVTWEQLVLDEARGELAWVIPIPRGGWIEPGDDHWFEALDEATAPVIAPHKALECGAAARESTAAYRTVTAPRVVSTGLHALSPSAAVDKLVLLGFVVDGALRSEILGLESAKEDVAILTLPAGARGVTKVVRVLGPAGRPLPVMLMPTGGALPRLTAYAFAEGRAKLAGLPVAEVDPAKLTWSFGRSNYRDLLDDAIIAASPGVALTFTGVDGVFTDQAAGSGAALPSLARRYFGAASECVSRVSALSTSSKIVAPTCAKASPWTSGSTPPGCTVTTGDQLSAVSLSCGALDDLAAASAGLAPSHVVVTRLEGVANTFAAGLPLQLSALGTVPSFREAKLGPLCTASGPTTTTPGNDPGTSTGNNPSSGSDGSSGGSPSSYSSSGDGCSSTAQVFADSCSRSSSSSDSGGCSGDSSSDSDGCSSDSSSSSGGCSGASDSADDGCSSSSGSSSSCSGAASSADDGCRASRVRPRVRFSAGVYALIAALAIARRFTRRNQYHRGLQGTCPEKTSTDVPAHE